MGNCSQVTYDNSNNTVYHLVIHFVFLYIITIYSRHHFYTNKTVRRAMTPIDSAPVYAISCVVDRDSYKCAPLDNMKNFECIQHSYLHSQIYHRSYMQHLFVLYLLYDSLHVTCNRVSTTLKPNMICLI